MGVSGCLALLGIGLNLGAFREGSAEDALLVMLGVLLVMLAVFGCLAAIESGY